MSGILPTKLRLFHVPCGIHQCAKSYDILIVSVKRASTNSHKHLTLAWCMSCYCACQHIPQLIRGRLSSVGKVLLMSRVCSRCYSCSNHVENKKWGLGPLQNSGITGGGAECPQGLLTGKFLLTYRGKKRQGKGVKLEKKRRKIVKGNGSRRKGYQKWWGPFFFFFFFFFAFHFWKRQKFVGSTKMGIFYILRREKN